jgi:hypothetical protein
MHQHEYCFSQPNGIPKRMYSSQTGTNLYVVLNALYELHHALSFPVWPAGYAEAPAVVLQHGLTNP